MNKEQLEEIMKPYYDKKNEIQEVKNKYEEEIKEIESKLNNLRKVKKNEMDMYISSALSFNRDFYDKDGLIPKRQLVENYSVEEEELSNKLEELNKELKNSIATLSEPVEGIKVEAIKQLLVKQEEMIKTVEEKRIELYNVKELIDFRTKDDSKEKIVADMYALYDKKNKITNEIKEITDNSRLVELYLLELTNGDESLLSKYGREKTIDEKIEDTAYYNFNEEIKKLDKSDIDKLITKNDSVSINKIDDKLEFSSSFNENISVNKDCKLPNGDKITSEDFEQAIEKYYEKQKDQSLVVDEIGRGLAISKEEIKNINVVLRQSVKNVLSNNNDLSKSKSNLELKKMLQEERSKLTNQEELNLYSSFKL